MYTSKKLLTAFGMRAPPWAEAAGTDDACFNLLVLAITRELSKRAKLMTINTVDDAVRLIAERRNIIVLTGAGISTSLGIPDFRSKDGLYAQLGELGLSDPQEVFDIDVFRDDPTIFYRVARDIWPSTDHFTPTHRFIAMLQERGKLLTNYSQNIDNLEAKAGIRPDKLVQCHGSFATATCIRCGHCVPGDEIYDDVATGRIPRCIACLSRGVSSKRKRSAMLLSSKKSSARKRSSLCSLDDDDDDDDDDDYANFPGAASPAEAGIMKPDITFFGEPLPDEFSRRLAEVDRDMVDLVIVIGTSLKVMPVSEIVGWLPAHVPQIYISREPVGHVNFDIDLLGDCDDVVVELCRRLGWPLVHEMVPPDLVVRVSTFEGFPSRHLMERVGVHGKGVHRKESVDKRKEDEGDRKLKSAVATTRRARRSTAEER